MEDQSLVRIRAHRPISRKINANYLVYTNANQPTPSPGDTVELLIFSV